MDSMTGMLGCCTAARPRNADGDRFGMGGGFSDRERVPEVLEQFLAVRQKGDAEAAASFCTDDVVMKGPMGKFEGLRAVKEKAFSLAAHPPKRVFMLMQYQPHKSTPVNAVYAREFEVNIGNDTVPLRQEFIVRGGKVALIEFSRLPAKD